MSVRLQNKGQPARINGFKNKTAATPQMMINRNTAGARRGKHKAKNADDTLS